MLLLTCTFSAYVPAPTRTVFPATAALIAAWIVLYTVGLPSIVTVKSCRPSRTSNRRRAEAFRAPHTARRRRSRKDPFDQSENIDMPRRLLGKRLLRVRRPKTAGCRSQSKACPGNESKAG